MFLEGSWIEGLEGAVGVGASHALVGHFELLAEIDQLPVVQVAHMERGMVVEKVVGDVATLPLVDGRVHFGGMC